MEVSQGAKPITFQGQDSRCAFELQDWHCGMGSPGQGLSAKDTCFEHPLINFLDAGTTCFT